MALEGSRGMLAEMVSRGASPSDPRATPTEMITRGLGGLLGVDARTQPEVLNSKMSNIDPGNPNAMEQQLTTMVQSEAVSPEQKMKAMAALQKIQQEKAVQARQASARKALSDMAEQAGKSTLSNVIRLGGIPLEDASAMLADPEVSEAAQRIIDEGHEYGSPQFKARMGEVNRNKIKKEGLKPKDIAGLYSKYTAPSVQRFIQDNSAILKPLDKDAQDSISAYGKRLKEEGIEPGSPQYQNRMREYNLRHRSEKVRGSTLSEQAIETYDAVIATSDKIPDKLKKWFGVAIDDSQKRLALEEAELKYQNNPSLGRAGALKQVLSKMQKTGKASGAGSGPVDWSDL